MFKRFQNKIFVMIIGLLIGLQAATFIVINKISKDRALAQTKEQLLAARKSFIQLMQDKSSKLETMGRLLISDFAFKEAYSSGNEPTIKSALKNHSRRIGADFMVLVSMEGEVVASTDHSFAPKSAFEFASEIEVAENSDQEVSKTIIFKQNRPYQMLLIPLKAPVTVAWIGLGFELNTGIASNLKEISSLEVSFVGQPSEENIFLVSTLPPNLKRGISSSDIFSLKEGHATFELNLRGAGYVSHAIRLKSHKNKQIYTVIKRSLAETMANVRKLQNSMVIIFLISLVISIIAAFYLGKSIAWPIEHLTDGATSVSKGNFSTQVEIDSDDEIGTLAKTFNLMINNLRKQVSARKNAVEKLKNANADLKDTNEQLDRKLFESSLMLEASKLVSQHVDTTGIANFMTKKMIEAFRYDVALLALVDEEDVVEIVSCQTFDRMSETVINRQAKSERMESIEVPLVSRCLNSKFIETTRPSEFKELLKIIGVDGVGENLNTCTTIPLIGPSSSRGLIILGSIKTANQIDEMDLNFLSTLATQTMLFIENNQLYADSITDGLTKLNNVRYFKMRLASELKRRERNREELALLLFDIDHFKKFNDTYGHQIGDLVLEEVGRVIKETCRETDIACRYGGEEFTVILPCTNETGAVVFAEKLRKNIEDNKVPTEHGELKVTVSIGVALAPLHTTGPQKLIRVADAALYSCKADGRNQVQLYRHKDTVKIAS